MTLLLAQGTKPVNLGIKTFGFGSLGNAVYLGNYEISLEDFLAAAEYVLTNTNLEPNDPRLQFVKRVQSMKEIDGYGPGKKRLGNLPQQFFYLPHKRNHTCLALNPSWNKFPLGVYFL